jgi:hypothetical protein
VAVQRKSGLSLQPKGTEQGERMEDVAKLLQLESNLGPITNFMLPHFT